LIPIPCQVRGCYNGNTKRMGHVPMTSTMPVYRSTEYKACFLTSHAGASRNKEPEDPRPMNPIPSSRRQQDDNHRLPPVLLLLLPLPNPPSPLPSRHHIIPHRNPSIFSTRSSPLHVPLLNPPMVVPPPSLLPRNVHHPRLRIRLQLPLRLKTPPLRLLRRRRNMHPHLLPELQFL
jgi:hypothetical protein